MRGLPAVAFATGEGGHAAEDRMLHVWAWRADADEAHGGSPSEARREARTLTPCREGSNPIPTPNPNLSLTRRTSSSRPSSGASSTRTSNTNSNLSPLPLTRTSNPNL